MNSQIQSSPVSSPLFATSPIVTTSLPPVVVVGLPRSGSSFLSHILSALDGWYVFDDLYAYQKMQSTRIQGKLTPEQLEDFVSRLGWSVRGQITYYQTHDLGFVNAPQCTWEDIDKMSVAMIETFKDRSVQWYELLEEWMVRLARHHNRTRWGYKTPQDFMHMDKLAEVFPGIRFIFIMRDPRKMMASKKNVVSEGNSDEYHPIPYALYWKMAYEKVQNFIKSGKSPVYTVKFEEMITDPDKIAQELASFLGTTVSGSVAVKSHNSSFKSQSKTSITDTETWICEKLAGNSMEQAGYSLKNSSPKLSDIPDLLETSWQFITSQTKRALISSRKRVSVISYLQTLFGLKSR